MCDGVMEFRIFGWLKRIWRKKLACKRYFIFGRFRMWKNCSGRLTRLWAFAFAFLGSGQASLDGTRDMVQGDGM